MENPPLDWVTLARGHGLPGARADSVDTFVKALSAGLANDGPSLIELACG